MHLKYYHHLFKSTQGLLSMKDTVPTHIFRVIPAIAAPNKVDPLGVILFVVHIMIIVRRNGVLMIGNTCTDGTN